MRKNPSREHRSFLCMVMSCTSAHPNVFDWVSWRYITFCINRVNEIAVRFNDCRWVYDLCCSFVCSWANDKQGWDLAWLLAEWGCLGIELTCKWLNSKCLSTRCAIFWWILFNCFSIYMSDFSEKVSVMVWLMLPSFRPLINFF